MVWSSEVLTKEQTAYHGRFKREPLFHKCKSYSSCTLQGTGSLIQTNRRMLRSNAAGVITVIHKVLATWMKTIVLRLSLKGYLKFVIKKLASRLVFRTNVYICWKVGKIVETDIHPSHSNCALSLKSELLDFLAVY
jgi:hypothetical protein